MKPFIPAFLLLVFTGLAQAQIALVAGQDPVASLEERRARISAERARLETSFSAEDAACYERFAVNSCLGKIDTRRRQAMAELRRQEISLNDEERKNRGEEQLRKTQEKSSPENLQEAAQRRAKALEDYQLRLEQEKTRQQERSAASSSEKAARDAYTQKLTDHQKKAQAHTDKQAQAGEEAKKLNDRQQAAQARRAEHEAAQLKRTNPAKSLPLPELPR